MDLVLIMSRECQSGKTTYVIKKMIKNLNEGDHFLFTFDRENVRADALKKFRKEAEKHHINVPVITDKKEIVKVYKDRLKGNIYPVICILMGNSSNFSAVKQLLSMENTVKFSQEVYLDEIHRYVFGEKSEDRVQIDNFINEIYENKSCTRITLISATAHDLLLSKLAFNTVLYHSPYEGFQGLRDAVWHTIDAQNFQKVLDEYKRRKKGIVDENFSVPQEMKDAFDLFASKDMILNLYHETDFHAFLVSLLPDTAEYNGLRKNLKESIVGRGSLGVSTTFENHNKVMYFANLKSRSTCISNIVQALGRANGTKKPVIITTPEIREAVEEYLQLIDRIISEKIPEKSPKERAEFFKNYSLKYYKIFPGNKLKKERHFEEKEESEPVLPSDTNEICYSLYAPKLYKMAWKGREPGIQVLKRLKKLDPEFFKTHTIQRKSLATETETRQDGSLFVKKRHLSRVRIGKNKNKKGYITIVIRTTEECCDAYYTTEEELKTLATTKVATVHSMEDHRNKVLDMKVNF